MENKLTEREIFEQIVALQKQITENNANSLHRLGDTIDSVYSTEEDTELNRFQRFVMCLQCVSRICE